MSESNNLPYQAPRIKHENSNSNYSSLNLSNDGSSTLNDGRPQSPRPMSERSTGTLEHERGHRTFGFFKRATKQSKPAPLIVSSPLAYKLHYLNQFSEVIYIKESKQPIAIRSSLASAEISVLEIITTVRTKVSYNDDNRLSYMLEVEPRHVLKVEGTELKINSPAIMAALQSVVEYYPGQAFSEDTITVPEPYAMLVHHEKELKEYRDRFAPNASKTPDMLCERKLDTYEHLGILQDFLQSNIGASVEAERERHKRGVATFEMLWLLLRPGTDVYMDTAHDGNLNAYVVESLIYKEEKGDNAWVSIVAWNLDYDGICVSRRSHTIDDQSRWDGEKDINALEVFPCQFLKESPKGSGVKPWREQLEDRGKMFFRLTSKQCMHYQGLATLFPKKDYTGQVMVDTDLYYTEINPGGRPPIGNTEAVAIGVSGCLCQVCLKLKDKDRTSRAKVSRFAGYTKIYPETTKELTAHQYFLCNFAIMAYSFQARHWVLLDICNFSNPMFDTQMIDTLVMSDDRRLLIKGLAKNYDKETKAGQKTAHRSWTADFVQGKGEGKIFLLHGKPGVGKTYTAECIAHFTQRPLLSLTVSDLGTDPSHTEANLLIQFKRAQRWDAIILIDEADIYMERRENQDLARNSLVSGFLRAMESCQSILFLTTNRVGAFDDAFISRIHISLYYPDFTEADRRKIWQMFFDKLARDRGNIMRVPIDTKDYTKSKEVKALKWNGREIRNAFQTAVALADFEGAKDEEGKILLKEEHIMQIVKMSREFKTYLRELHRGDEAKRADRQRIRYDEFDPDDGDSDDGKGKSR